jgi:hypothetical protein
VPNFHHFGTKKRASNLFKDFFEKNSKLPHFEETKVEFAIFKTTGIVCC